MGYTIFFVIVTTIGAVVFFGIFEAGWLSSSSPTKTEAKSITLNQSNGQGRSFYTINTAESGIKLTSIEYDQSTRSPGYSNAITSAAQYINTTTEPWINIQTTKQIPSMAVKFITELTTQMPVTTSQPMTEQSSTESTAVVQAIPTMTQTLRVDISQCKIENKLVEVNGTIKSPQPYPTGDTCTIWPIEFEAGYDLDITIEGLTLIGPDDLLLIASDINQLMAEFNPVIAGKLTTKKRFRVLKRGKAVILFKTFASNLNGKATSDGFTLLYARYGEKEVPTEPPTTLQPIPTPPANTDYNITVYLAGLTPDKAENKSMQFREFVANLSDSYCTKKAIVLKQRPEYRNVQLSKFVPCLRTWPDFETCSMVTIAVGLNTSNNQYELTKPHLQDMWDNTARGHSDLNALGLEVYDVPDYNSAVLLWVGVSLAVVAVFVLILIFVWRLQVIQEYKRMITKPDQRESEISERSSYIDVPPNFPADYLMYKPVHEIFASEPPAEDSSDFDETQRNSLAQPAYETQNLPYGFRPPSYGLAEGYGAAVRFYGRPTTGANNLAFVEEEEYDTSQAENTDENSSESNKNETSGYENR